jgi:hypothetical protein
MVKSKKVYPTISSTDGRQIQKVKVAEKLGVEEICFFATCLDFDQRKEFYRFLQNSAIKRIPLVHLRNDMELWELDFFVKNFQTEAFNHHSISEYRIINDWSKYRQIIYLENTFFTYKEEELSQLGGVCIDFAHLEDTRRRRQRVFKKEIRIIKKYSCGCAHISAIGKRMSKDRYSKRMTFDHHTFEDLSEFDYLKNYPAEFFPSVIALELENTLEEQLKVKEYLEKILPLT